MNSRIHVEVHCAQKNYGEERICGDVFLSKRIKEEKANHHCTIRRYGSWVKANVLATLTSTMALNFTMEHKEPKKQQK
jgi:hypothetical protein